MAAIGNEAVSFGDTYEAARADFADDSNSVVNGFDPRANRRVPGQSAVSGGRRPNVPGANNNSKTTNAFYTNRNVEAAPPRPLSGVGVGATSYTPGMAMPGAAGLTRVPILPRQTMGKNRPRLLALTVPHPVVLLAGMLIIMLVGFIILSNLVQWWQTWQDDMTYGRPRTYQLDAWVGHNEQGGHPTHFIAQNLDRQMSIIEYPGGDPTKMRVLVGPHLYGKNDDLLPVKIRLVDVNGDGHVDLIATLGSQNIVYINENGQFRLLQADERSLVNLPASGS